MIKMKELLREFELQVAALSYEKLPYYTWRDLKKCSEEPVDIRVDRDLTVADDVYEITLQALDSKKSFYFYEDDYSFGSFLYDQIREGYFDPVTTAKMAVCPIGENKNKSIITWDTLGDMAMIKKDTTISSALDQMTIKMNLNKENNDMDNKLFKNFDFGPCTSNNIKMSLYGLAVKNASDTWVSYDSKTDSVIDVDIINFDGAKYFYKLPVAIKDVVVGDIVIHNRKPVFVKAIEDNRIIAVDPAAGEEKAVLLTKSPFGFDFCTKVVNLFDGITGGASADSPFGNMLPFFLLSDDKGNSDLLPLLLLSQNGGNFLDNPMALYFLAGNNKGNDLLPLLLLGKSTGYAFGTPAAAPAN